MLDVNQAFNAFDEIMYSCYNETYPLTTKTIQIKDKETPWITSGIRQSVKTKNKLYKKFFKRPITYGETYRAYRNNLTQIIKQSKCDYYKNKFDDSKGNLKETWKNINKILGKSHVDETQSFQINGERVIERERIANEFNKYYCSIGSDTAKKLPASNHNFEDYLPNENYNEIEFNQTTVSEIKAIISKCKDSTAGPDQLPISLFKENKDTLSPVISYLCNLSIYFGIFPTTHKIGKVTPLYKNKE